MDHAASKTALLVAAYRGRESAREKPLIHDPWASALAGEDGVRLSEAHDEANPSGQLYIALRTAYLDHQVISFLGHGASQVVVLGAGFDSRAARLKKGGAIFFEVDHPHTQAEKIRRLSNLHGYPIDCAKYVSCDFETQDFLDRLVAEGFDVARSSVFVWEGVTFYLTESAVRSTLRRVASGCHENTVILFDFIERRMAEGGVRGDDEKVRTSLRELGEPLLFGKNDMLPLLYEVGFRHVRITSFDEVCLHLTGTYERSRKFRFQHIGMASRGPFVEP